MSRVIGRQSSTRTASLVGIGVGVAVLALYLVGGLLVANWSVADFASHLTLETVGTLLLLGLLAVATFTVPIVAYARFHVVSPVAVLALVVFGWVGSGIATGVLWTETVFGLGLYAVGLSPLYLVCYGVLGCVELYARRRLAS